MVAVVVVVVVGVAGVAGAAGGAAIAAAVGVVLHVFVVIVARMMIPVKTGMVVAEGGFPVVVVVALVDA